MKFTHLLFNQKEEIKIPLPLILFQLSNGLQIDLSPEQVSTVSFFGSRFLKMLKISKYDDFYTQFKLALTSFSSQIGLR